jgi:hypothetical protein
MPRQPDAIERISNVYTEPKPEPYVKPRRSVFGEIVDRLTLVGQVVSRVEFANALLLGAVDLLYDVDSDNQFANFDIDGRVIVSMPWGSTGHVKWNVRSSEANCLRRIMMQRGTQPGAWIVYQEKRKGWYVTHRTSRHAFAMLAAFPITNEEWRRGWEATETEWARENLPAG